MTERFDLSDVTIPEPTAVEGRPALMCVDDDDRRKAVRAVLKHLGFDPETPADPTAASR